MRKVYNDRVKRNIRFKAVEYCKVYDIGKEAGSTTFELEGLEAYIVQHEIDHAKGIDIYHK